MRPTLSQMKYCFYILVLLAWATGGCAMFPRQQTTALKVADELEVISLGTVYADVLRSVSTSHTPPIRALKVKYMVHGHLRINPTDQAYENLKLYRQWPKGILLELYEDDIELELKVADKKSQDGRLYVYFDRTGQYKGYFTHSTARYSKDDPGRLEAEKKSYRELGFEAECVRAGRTMELIRAGGEALDKLPKLPLSKNRAQISH